MSRKVVNVRFHDAGRLYRYTCDGFSLSIGDAVVVDTTLGMDVAFVTEKPLTVCDNLVGDDIKPVLRLPDKQELERSKLKKEKEQEAYELCLELIEKNKLNMNLIEAYFSFDGKKILFYYTSENRVDFRELLKDLAYAFKARIDLRQIGSRDQARLVGGLGMCGRELCCCTFLDQFAPVSLKAARDQNLSLNPSKLNGACGRLMCCLQYERAAYADAKARLPKPGKKIKTPEGVGIVDSVDLMKETVRVKFDDGTNVELQVFEWAGLEPMNPELAEAGYKEAERIKNDALGNSKNQKQHGDDNA